MTGGFANFFRAILVIDGLPMADGRLSSSMAPADSICPGGRDVCTEYMAVAEADGRGRTAGERKTEDERRALLPKDHLPLAWAFEIKKKKEALKVCPDICSGGQGERELKDGEGEKGKGENVMYGTRLEAKLDGLAGQVSWLADEL